MSNLAKAMTRYSRENLNDIIEAWTTAFTTLYARPELTRAKNETLLGRYLEQRMAELVG